MTWHEFVKFVGLLSDFVFDATLTLLAVYPRRGFADQYAVLRMH